MPTTPVLAAQVTFALLMLMAMAVAEEKSAPPTKAAGADPRQTFEQAYALDADQVIRRVPPPFHPWRLKFLREQGETEQRQDHLDAGMIVTWRAGRPAVWGKKSATVPWYAVHDLVGHFVGVPRWDLEGEEELKNLSLPGDFVIGPKATKDARERYRAGIERITGEVLGRRVTLAFREVERPVLILKGRWQYTPVREHTAEAGMPPTLELYGERLVRPPAEGGEAIGTIEDAAAQASDYLGRRVLIECEGAPAELRVRRHELAPGAAGGAGAGDVKLVLKRLEEQTGLTAVEESRKVRRLFISSGA